MCTLAGKTAPALLYLCRINQDKCGHCGTCQEVIFCPSPGACIGCLACLQGCPYHARELVEDESSRKIVRIQVDGEGFEAPERITVKRALEMVGLSFGVSPGEGDIQAPCCTGGCYTCLVLADGRPVRSCVSPVRERMAIRTELPDGFTPVRVIHGPQPHSVGGKATPWWLKARGRYIELAIWVAGCNLRCPQCQNFTTTYDGRNAPLSPRRAAERVTRARHRYGVDRMAISGGEPALNRPWLVQYFSELRALNPDPDARLHLDSNGTLLSRDYIDELIDAGATDIGIEPKGVYPETFMCITGIEDEALARRYLETAWRAIEYVVSSYKDRVFLGVGLPYNRVLIGLEEVRDFGRKLASIDPGTQLSILDYFPTFRSRDIERPQPGEMLTVKRVLEGAGLKAVVVQTAIGHIGPG